MELTRNFSELNKNDAHLAGGKGASLGEMTQADIPVPPGFVVLSDSFEQFIKETDLVQEIDGILSKVNHKEIHTVEAASEAIRALILNAEMPKDIAVDISKQFKALNAKYVAVRSSATAEDGKEHAWAGQLESYLNTQEDDVLTKVKLCWSSLFTPRAIFYRFEKGLDTTKISVAVVVQKMVESEVSGIAFSVHPVTEDYNQLIIEAGFGLGEAIVSGSVTPDSYVVEKEPRKILDINISTQDRGLYRSEKSSAEHGNNEWITIPEPKASSQVLTEAQILELSEIILKIENHYGFPCDIEWAFEAGKFYIVQSRPITTLARKIDKTTTTTNPIDSYLQALERENQKIYAVLANTSVLLYFSKWNKSEYWAKHFNNQIPFFVAGVARQGEFFSYPTDNTLAACSLEFIKKYLSSPDLLTETKNHILGYIKNSSELYETSSRDVILKFDFKKKIDLLKRTLDLVWEGNALGGIAVHFDKDYILDKLIELGNPISPEDLLAIWDKATHPVDESFAEEQKRYLLSQVIKGLPRDEIIQKCQYFYTSYLDAKDLSIVEKKITDEYSGILDIPAAKSELEKMDMVLSKRREEYNEWFKTLNKNQKTFTSYIQGIIFIRDARKTFVNRGLTIVWHIAEAIANEAGTEKSIIPFLTIDELEQGAESIKNNVEEIKKRLNGVCHYCDDKGNLSISLCDYEAEKKRLDEKLYGTLSRGNETLIKGQVGSPGKVTGKVRIILSVNDKNATLKKGEILVTGMTRPEFVPLMKIAAGIVTDEGGITCHAAIVSRELGIPCVIGTKVASQILKDGDEVELDADNGIVKVIKEPILNPQDYFLNFKAKGPGLYFAEIGTNSYDPNHVINIIRNGLYYSFYTNDGAQKNAEFAKQKDFFNIVSSARQEIEKLQTKYKDFELSENLITLKEFNDIHSDSLNASASYRYVNNSYLDAFITVGTKEQVAKMGEHKNEMQKYLFDIFFSDQSVYKRVLRNISTNTQVPYDDIEQYYHADLVLLLKENKKLDQNVLTARKHSTALTKDDNGIVEIIASEKADALFTILYGSNDNHSTLKGMTGYSNGKIVTGTVKIIHTDYKDIEKVKKEMAEMEEGQILVSQITAPELMPAIKKAKAIVTDIGGLLSHAAIISRELGIPCVIGTKNASEVLKNGDEVEVDADKGIVRIINKFTPKPQDYLRMFAGRSFVYLFSDIFLKYYGPLGIVSVQDPDGWMSFFPKALQEKTLKDGKELYTSPELYKKYNKEFHSYIKSSSKYFEPVLIKDRIDAEDIEEYMRTAAEHFSYYSKTEFFYTDLVDQNNMALTVQEFDKLKLDGRSHLNKIAFEEDGYVKRLAQKISLQTEVPMQDLLRYSIKELVELVKNNTKLTSKSVKDKDIFFDSENLKLFGKEAEALVDEFLSVYRDLSNIIKGVTANKGKVTGKARVLIPDFKDFSKIAATVEEMQEGEILIAETTAPEIIKACKKASAIVTNQGGMLSHAAIISRELNIPCIVGTDKDVILNIKTGDMLDVDADKGIIRILKNENTNPTKIGGKEWKLVVTRNASHWHNLLMLRGYVFNTKDFGVGAPCFCLTVSIDSTRSSIFMETESLGIYSNAVMEAFSTKEKVVSIKNKYQEIVAAALEALKEADRNLTLETWGKFLAAYQRLTAGLMITAIFGRGGSEKMVELLKKKEIDENEIHQIISTVTYPVEHTPLFDSQLALMQIGSKIQNGSLNNQDIEAELSKWLEEYGCIPVNFCEEPWNMQDAKLQLESVMKKDCKKELAKAVEDHERKASEKKVIFNKLNDPELEIVASALAEATYLNEFRKNAFCRISLGYRGMFTKIAALGGSKNWRDIFYLVPEETIALLAGEKIDISKLVTERQLAGAYVNDEGKEILLDQNILIGLEAFIRATYTAPKASADSVDFVKGFSANRGKVKGIARIILSSKDFGKLKSNEILVTTMTSVDFVPVMERATAFVTNEGGITSHAAIVAREMNKPCVIGTKTATQVIKDGDMVEVDADKGIVKILK